MPLCCGGGGVFGPGCGAAIGAIGMGCGSAVVLAMNIPGCVYSWPLSSEKCICQRSIRPGEVCTVCIVSGSPPLRVPSLMMATSGCSACTSTGELELDCPWCSPNSTSTVPRRFVGHIRSNSLFLVISPRCAVRNLPYVTKIPTDIGSSALLSPGLYSEQKGLGPPPGGGVLITSPAEVTPATSTPP